MKKKKEILEIFYGKSISFATVSGIVTTSPGMIRRIDNEIPEFALVTTKSYQINPNPGNREPVIVEPEEGSFGNAVGLRNPGMAEGFRSLKKLLLKKPLRAVLNISVSGNSVEEFIILVKHFETIADSIELNFSCPHAAGGYGMAIGTDPEVVFTYLKNIREVTDVLLFPKLTPNVTSISETALAAVEGGADGITAVNTVGPALYREPHSGMPILQNASGNRGGMSGRWIKDIALEKVFEIRQSVGPDIPIIGMGGIETGEDVRNMKEAGASLIGIGSLFASVHPDDWKHFFPALKEDALHSTAGTSGYRTGKKKMEYIPHIITAITDLPGNVRILELDGRIHFCAGQFAFLWIPGTGEKPFSIMKGNPPTFLVRKKGIFTSRIMELKTGDTLFVRGVYGKSAPGTQRRIALVAAGGTGLASALKLAEEHFREGREVHTFYGMRSEGQEIMKEDFQKWGSFTAVSDNGIPGRVIDTMMEMISENSTRIPGKRAAQNCALYTIGPLSFMEKAAAAFLQKGGGKEDIFLSLETPTRCGIGLCGECENGGHLTCREGTFFTWKSLNED